MKTVTKHYKTIYECRPVYVFTCYSLLAVCCTLVSFHC